MTAPAELMAHYLAARYEVALGGHWIEIALDQPNPQLCSMLPATQRCWGIVGAVNPRSRNYPAALNARRHRAALRWLRNRGLHAFPARGRALDGSWQEAAWLVCANSPRPIHWVACRYNQHAVVLGHGDSPGRLHVYELRYELRPGRRSVAR